MAKISKAAKIAEYDRRQSDEYRIAQHEAANVLRLVIEKMQDNEIGALKAYLNLAEADYRIVRNIMSKKYVVERADLPYHCSVSSESYWQN